MKKKILVSLLILGFAAGCGKIPKMANGEDALVSFKDSKNAISVNDLYSKIKTNYALNSLIDMIDSKILLEKYPDKDEEAEKYVDEQFTSIKKYYVDDDGKYDEKSLLSALNQYYGISTVEDFKTMLNLSFYRNLAVEDYAKEGITEKQINKYYEDEVVGDIQCSHILIAPATKDSMTDDEKKAAEKAALDKANEVIKKLKAGEDFSTLAKEYSTDEASKEKGGDLGYFNKGQMVEGFEDVAFGLKLNEYTTTPVKTTYGYHIIKKTGEKEKATLEKSKTKIIEDLAKEAQTNDPTLQINALVDLRKEYGMDIQDDELAKQYSTYISNQLLTAQNSATSTTTTKKAK